MKSKKIALLASILMVTLVVGVYAVSRLSNPITTSWTLRESGNNIRLYWETDPPALSDGVYRGEWVQVGIGLENIGEATYDVIGRFRIWTVGTAIPDGCITIEYYVAADPGSGEVIGWNDMSGVLSGWGTKELTGWFGPSTGWTVDPDYDNVVTQFQILFDGDAPLVGYGFEGWVEEV